MQFLFNSWCLAFYICHFGLLSTWHILIFLSQILPGNISFVFNLQFFHCILLYFFFLSLFYIRISLIRSSILLATQESSFYVNNTNILIIHSDLFFVRINFIVSHHYSYIIQIMIQNFFSCSYNSKPMVSFLIYPIQQHPSPSMITYYCSPLVYCCFLLFINFVFRWPLTLSAIFSVSFKSLNIYNV